MVLIVLELCGKQKPALSFDASNRGGSLARTTKDYWNHTKHKWEPSWHQESFSTPILVVSEKAARIGCNFSSFHSVDCQLSLRDYGSFPPRPHFLRKPPILPTPPFSHRSTTISRKQKHPAYLFIRQFQRRYLFHHFRQNILNLIHQIQPFLLRLTTALTACRFGM